MTNETEKAFLQSEISACECFEVASDEKLKVMLLLRNVIFSYGQRISWVGKVEPENKAGVVHVFLLLESG